MKTYIITEKSRRAALVILRAACLPNVARAIETLCVEQVPEAEGWELKSSISFQRYVKGKYILEIDDNVEGLSTNTGLYVYSRPKSKSSFEAQAWADAEIAKYEAAHTPKSLRPGTRLRAKNGDELVVIRDSDGLLCVINWTQKITYRFHVHDSNAEDLRQALEAAGATVIEEGPK